MKHLMYALMVFSLISCKKSETAVARVDIYELKTFISTSGLQLGNTMMQDPLLGPKLVENANIAWYDKAQYIFRLRSEESLSSSTYCIFKIPTFA